MDPELDRVNEQLALLLLHTQSGMDPDQAKALTEATTAIETKYKAAFATLADKNASDADKKYAKEVTDSINKNLPNFMKAGLSAASAFKSGDNLAGSAAIMDMCASGAAMIGSLSAAAGPYGAVFGAVFSMIGQLLTYFGPKQPSLRDQIKDLLEGLSADHELQSVKADGDSVEEYATTICRVKLKLPLHLKKPLETNKDIVNFQAGLKNQLISINGAYSVFAAKYGKWYTAQWLKDEKNHELEKWPEILGVFCRVYSDSLLANMALAGIVDRQLLMQRIEDSSSSNPNYEKNRNNFDQVNNLLVDLLATMDALPDLWDDGNRLMLKFLDEIRPVAQSRGLFLHLGYDNKYLYGATGRKGIQSDRWTNLSIGYGGRGHRFSVTVPKQNQGSAKPEYHLFFCEHWIGSGGGGDLEHGKVKPSPVGISGQGVVSKDKFSDVWALPAPTDKQRDAGATFVYAALDDGTSGSVKLFELDGKHELKPGNWQPATKSGLVNVRAVTHPPAPLRDDPDKDGLPPKSDLLGGVDHYNSITYGAMRSSSEIYVDQLNTRCYVPAPWATYSGIDVDPYYVWVFRPEGVACATHASVISCILGKRTAPRWMEHSPGDVLGDQSDQGRNNKWLVDGQETTGRPPLKGILSLSACKDGTFYASIYSRTVTKSDTGPYFLFEAKDTLASYTTSYKIDVKEGRLNVAPWEKCAGVARQVQKMPIPCWSLFESLDAVLRAKLKTQ